MIAAALAMMASLILAVAPARAEPLEPRSDGELLYQVYCLACHGEAGTGDGPMVPVLRIRPSNLRLIRARHGGTFPARDLYDVIDGRRAIKGHGTRDMPLWGYGFQEFDTDLTQEGEVRAKIVALIEFLESIQEPARGAKKKPGKVR